LRVAVAGDFSEYDSKIISMKAKHRFIRSLERIGVSLRGSNFLEFYSNSLSFYCDDPVEIDLHWALKPSEPPILSG